MDIWMYECMDVRIIKIKIERKMEMEMKNRNGNEK